MNIKFRERQRLLGVSFQIVTDNPEIFSDHFVAHPQYGQLTKEDKQEIYFNMYEELENEYGPLL